MKLKTILLAAASLATAASAYSQSAIIEITGATAFRSGTLDLIRQQFIASGGTYKIAHDGATFNAATRAIFRGNFRCADGTTLNDVVIRTFFSGSSEGLRSLDQGVPDAVAPTTGTFDETYFTVASIAAQANNTTVASFAGATEKAAADFALSDVDVAAIPTIDGSDFVGGGLGIVTFTMLANDGTTVAPFNGLTNVSAQNFRALVTNGFVPLSLFSGVAADETSFVATVGRNDGSGTRVVYLAEPGFGATNLVQQYQASNITSNGAGGAGTTGSGIINTIQLVPAVTSTEFDTNGSVTKTYTTNTSTVFGNPVVAGNGGYASGSDLRRIFGYSTKSTSIVAPNGSTIKAAAPIALVTCLSTADAIAAITAGARPLAYNGVSITPAAPLSAADTAKITSGQYTMWSVERIYGKDLDANESLILDTFTGLIGPVITANGTGISLLDMKVARDVDGGTINPL